LKRKQKRNKNKVRERESNNKMKLTPLEKVLLLKCSLHPSNQSDILNIAAGAATHKACIKCILSGVVPSLAALDIRSLF